MSLRQLRPTITSGFYISIAIFAIFLVPQNGSLLPAIQPAHATPLTTLSLSSPAYVSRSVVDPAITTGNSFVMRVNVTGDVGNANLHLNAFDIRIDWDPVVLEATAADYVGGIFDTPAFSQIAMETANDHVRLAGFLLGDDVPPDGMIFFFTLRALAMGSTILEVNGTASVLRRGTATIQYKPVDGFFSNNPAEGDFVVETISVSNETAPIGRPVDIQVAVRNAGSIARTSVLIDIRLNGTILTTVDLGSMAPGATTTAMATWNTTGFATGLYRLNATATITPIDGFTRDNTLETEQVLLFIIDMAVTNISVTQASARINTTVPVTTIIRNLGTTQQLAVVRVLANDTAIRQESTGATQQSQQLSAGVAQKFFFYWNTTSLTPGTYELKSTVKILADEANTADNELVNGTIVMKLKFDHELQLLGTPGGGAPRQGENVTIAMNIKNDGLSAETFTFRLFLNNTMIYQVPGSLAPSALQAVTFEWKTKSLQPARYVLKANVTATSVDEFPQNNEATSTVVLLANKLPKPFIDIPSQIQAGSVIIFNATKSDDAEGEISYFIWDFGDGTTITTRAQTINYTYGSAGTYEVKLTVIDQHGGTNSTSRTVTVVPAPSPARIPYELIGIGGAAAAAAGGGLYFMRRRKKPAGSGIPEK